MKLLADYHTHTIYSRGHLPFSTKHATGTIEENVLSAIEKGLKTVGISDHGYSHYIYGLRKEDIPDIRKEIDRLNKKYSEIEILLGVECNLLDIHGNIDMDSETSKYFDYINLGYHFASPIVDKSSLQMHTTNFLSNGRRNIVMNTEAFVNAIERHDIFYITHPGDKGVINIYEVAKVAKRNNTGLEINASHKHLNIEELKLIEELKPDIYIGSDAHKPQMVGNVERGFKIAEKSGIDLKLIKNIEL